MVSTECHTARTEQLPSKQGHVMTTAVAQQHGYKSAQCQALVLLTSQHVRLGTRQPGENHGATYLAAASLAPNVDDTSRGSCSIRTGRRCDGDSTPMLFTVDGCASSKEGTDKRAPSTLQLYT